MRSAIAVGERHEQVGVAEVSVVLRDLVLGDEVIAERVPRQLADRAVVLVVVVAAMGEDDVGDDAPPEHVEHILDLGADVREVALAEPVHLDVGRAGIGEEGGGARPRLGLPAVVGGEHDPVHVVPGRSASSRSIVPPQPISMSSLWAPRQSTGSGALGSVAERRPSTQSTVASGIGTMNWAPQSRTWASCSRISSLKFHGRIKM